MDNKFIERLQYFMKERGINDNQMTVAAGLSVGLLGKLKKNGKGMSSPNIEKVLLAYPELNAAWLLTGEGEMLRKTGQGTGQHYNIGDVSGSHNAFGSKTVSVRTRDGDAETTALLRQQIELLQRQNEQQARQNEQQARMIETLTRLLDAK